MIREISVADCHSLFPVFVLNKPIAQHSIRHDIFYCQTHTLEEQEPGESCCFAKMQYKIRALQTPSLSSHSIKSEVNMWTICMKIDQAYSSNPPIVLSGTRP